MRSAMGILGIVILVGVSGLTFYQALQTELAFEGEVAFSILSALLTALCMFVGIVFGGLFRRLEGRKSLINPLKEILLVFRTPSFLSALCVSPFVYFAVYVLVRESPGDPASYLLAFQNGFFCEAIFKRMFREETSEG